MVRIGRSPAHAALPLVLPVTVGAGVAVAWQIAALVGDPAWTFPVAFVAFVVLLAGGTLTGLMRYYRPVAFDPGAGLARLGRATVPLSSVTSARREVRAGRAGSPSRYLSYRFAATGGAWGRVLVSGRPMRGLDPEQRRLLEQFVTATAIEDQPAPAGLAPSQQLLAEAIGMDSVTDFQPYAATRPVGKAELLAELRGEAPDQAAAETELPPLLTLYQQWNQDDEEAASVVLRSAADTVRRTLGWLTTGAVVAGFAVILLAAVLEDTSGLSTDANDAVAAGVALAVVIGVLGYLGYAVASVVSTRRAQRVVLAWVRDRDPGQLARGLPPRLLSPFRGTPPGNRLRMAGAWASTLVAVGALTSGVVAGFFVVPATVVVLLVVGGLAALGAALVLFRRIRRAAGAQHELAARLGGRRLAAQLTDAVRSSAG